MNQKQRIVQQRVLAQQAIGQLKAVTELFGSESEILDGRMIGYLEWDRKIKEFEAWVFGNSPIA